MKSNVSDAKADACAGVILLLCLVAGTIHFASGGIIG